MKQLKVYAIDGIVPAAQRIAQIVAGACDALARMKSDDREGVA